LGGVIAAASGLRWLGVELEPRFVELGNRNIEKHQRELEAFGDPVPVLLQGDSRGFAAIVASHLQAVLTSPPYAGKGEVTARSGMGKTEEQLRAWWESYRAQGGRMTYEHFVADVRAGGRTGVGEYGAAPGQLARLPTGDLDATLTSPPYARAGQ